MTIAIEENLQLGVRRRHGRSINAVADFLRYKFPKLSVPNIYIEPRISLLSGIDVLAIDRAGSGDFHIVEVKDMATITASSHLDRYVESLKKLPGHFRYIALSQASNPERFVSQTKLFAKNGIGRVGIILLDENGLDLPKVTVFSPAERFQVDGESLEKIEKAVSKRKPDIEVRI
jgi:hypothetical protein